ncbi:ribonuclease H-like domain-containing protein [Tanacetum coccineum]
MVLSVTKMSVPVTAEEKTNKRMDVNAKKLATHQDLEQIHEDDLEAIDLKWQLSLLSMRAKRYFQRTRKKIFINANDTAGYDISKQGNNEDTSSKEMLAIDGVGFDWSDMAGEHVQTNMALMAFSDSEVYNNKTCIKTCLKNYKTLKKQCDDLIVKLNQTEFTAATYKRGLATVEEQLIAYRQNKVLFSKEVAVLKREIACKDYEINVLKSEFEKVKQEKEGIEFKIEKLDNASKSLDKLLGSQITDKSKKGLGYNVVPPPHLLIYNQPKKLDLSYFGLDEFKDPEFKSYGSEDSKQESNIVCDNKSNDSKKNSDDSLVKEQVLEDTSSFVESLFNVDKETVFLVDKKIEFVKPKNHEKPIKKSVRVNYNYTTNRTHPNAQRNMVPRAVLMKTGLKPFNTARTVNTAHPKSIVFSAKPMQKVVNTARPKAVNTTRPHSAVVNAVRVNQENVVKASTCWVCRPTKLDSASITLKKDNYIDARGRSNGCSRHMTRNIAYLSDLKEFDEGYVTFGEGAHGGRISSKGTLKTYSLDFEDPDESQTLLKIPRKDNIYSFDMKNIVPKESLTCLVAKATSDESMLWHRRLGHINFKNINKLVKDNLFAKPSILGKPVGQPLKNQSVVRQPTAFKSERPKISKERFASQVDVSNDLSKPVTTHYLPKRRESAPANLITRLQTAHSSEPPNGSKGDITNQCESEQALDVSAGTLLSTDDHKMMSDHNSSDLAPQRQEMSVENPEKTDSSNQGLEFLFSPFHEEYYNPTHDQAEENNNDQAPNASFQEAEFINPFCTRQHKSFPIYHMDVKTAFLNGPTEGRGLRCSVRKVVDPIIQKSLPSKLRKAL